MSPKKLTDDDKQEILKLYRQTPETTSTLADRYGVSSSTISRFLKNTLSDMEYEDLIQKKRLARTHKPEPVPELELELDLKPEPVTVPEEIPQLPEKAIEVKEVKAAPVIIKKESPAAIPETPPITSQKPSLTIEKPALRFPVEEDDDDDGEDLEEMDVVALGEMLGEDIDDEDDEDDDWDEDDEDDDESDYNQSLSSHGDVQVLPLSAATFPRTCYLVIDRTAELIVRPLKEFAHLGQIPTDELQQKTLPVFDNHRVARRFSNRSQRVIKVPDGRLLYKTCSYLQAKGITRLLMDGQIYSLANHSEN
ncbi:transposase [Crocosphaera sp. UHCC 0190]|uniref:transposase n=1 Tax=Crocosphaera sp. UHCC 0190 TaxID=3110246 RepID=UPI002B1F4C39|nr:transposase [Crocosphaera sp. UHCC 0190]MEA5511702.1 transposase [Crocosphaera sp. UHCC 0190]